MKIIVTHSSPDLDAIMSAWLIKRFLPGWENANVQFVSAGERMRNSEFPGRAGKIPWMGRQNLELKDPIEKIGNNEVIHVDTGLGLLDHHQTPEASVSAASLTWEFVKSQVSGKIKDKEEAIERMVRVVVDIDHFREVFWKDRLADYHEFSLVNILDGLKIKKPDQDGYYVDFISSCFDAILHQFENRIWAEKEIAQNGKKFETRWGEGIGFETINDSVLKLAQKMGYVLVIRKDPRKGYVRIKAKPDENGDKGIDLTLAYEKFKKIDPGATWFLHIGKKMLLNGSVKNPKMRPTKLSLDDIIKVIEKI